MRQETQVGFPVKCYWFLQKFLLMSLFSGEPGPQYAPVGLSGPGGSRAPCPASSPLLGMQKEWLSCFVCLAFYLLLEQNSDFQDSYVQNQKLELKKRNVLLHKE